jgi:hypothetical protein
LENEGAWGEGILERKLRKYDHQAIHHLRTWRFVLQCKTSFSATCPIHERGGADL